MSTPVKTNRPSVVRSLLARTKLLPLPESLFRDQQWKNPFEARVVYEPDIPFSFHVVGIGDVELCTTTPAVKQTDFALVLHKMGSNHRLKAVEWRTASFPFALYQSQSPSAGDVYGKRLQCLKLCDQQPSPKSGEKQQIVFELVGETFDYDDVTP